MVTLSDDGRILDAGWRTGAHDVVSWIRDSAEVGDVIAIDAPLVITNEDGMRDCEREVAQRYMSPWLIGANATNLSTRNLEGRTVRVALESAGIHYADGLEPHDPTRTEMIECYPYTTIAGAWELGFEMSRPRYKRLVKALPSADRRMNRALECDVLIAAVSNLRTATPPVDLRSHPETRVLIDEPSPLNSREYKHREDLLDAVLCAWTAALWATGHLDRVQILGANAKPDDHGRRPTIVAPARPEQRRLG